MRWTKRAAPAPPGCYGPPVMSLMMTPLPRAARAVTARLVPGLCTLSISAGMLLGLAGCGGGNAQYDGQTVQDAEEGTSYAIASPGDGWRRVSVEGQNDLAFVSDTLSAVIQVNASCSAELDIPLQALRNHLLIGFTERELQSEELIELDGREALRTHTRAKLDGVQRELVLVVLKKNGCVYDFALVAPPGPRFTSAVDRFDAMVQGFHTDGREP